MNRPGTDDSHMVRALSLAARGGGRTSPNPMVGAVIVRAGRIVGEGWHRAPGQPHAEIEAIQNAIRKGHSTRGATLYVTLEPCCTRGRTPPCTDAIIRHGFRKIVVAATDPNPSHSGRGFDLLRKAGIEVRHGLLEEDSHRLNAAFNHWILHHTPLVTSKVGLSLDGRIATRTGESKWITSPESRRKVMHLRSQNAAILTGVGTILADDPSLTVRRGEITARYQPQRWILDSRARTPLTARVTTDAHAAGTVIVTTTHAPIRRIRALAKQVDVRVLPGDSPRPDLARVLQMMGAEEIHSVLLEAGGTLQGSFLDAQAIHRIAWFYAPKILGGRDAMPAVGGMGARDLGGSACLSARRLSRVGPDLLLEATVEYSKGVASKY